MTTQHDAPAASKPENGNRISAPKAKSKKTSKKQKLVKANLKQSNGKKKAVLNKKEAPAKSERTLMYIYADGMTPEEKKTFRRQTRAAIRQLEKKMDKINTQEHKTKADREELKKLQGEMDKVFAANRNPDFGK